MNPRQQRPTAAADYAANYGSANRVIFRRFMEVVDRLVIADPAMAYAVSQAVDDYQQFVIQGAPSWTRGTATFMSKVVAIINEDELRRSVRRREVEMTSRCKKAVQS